MAVKTSSQKQISILFQDTEEHLPYSFEQFEYEK